MLSAAVQEVLKVAVQEVQRRRHELLTVEHILFSLTTVAPGRLLLEGSGASVAVLREQLEGFFRNEMQVLPDQGEHEVHQTAGVQRVLERALGHIHASGRSQVELGDLFVAILDEEDSYAHYFLTRQGVDRLDALTFISHGMPEGGGSRGVSPDAAREKEEGEAGENVLEKYATELTARARDGKIDPLVGRQEELDRAIEVLCRRRKNNPLFVGDPGVGKTALAEGLALRIAQGQVPKKFKDVKIYALDMGLILAGTRYRGEFESRLKAIVEELKNIPDAVVFIDEIHTIVGAGSTQGSLDTANILKPALARGELQTIGATTLDEYRENIESDSALERRFQKVVVEPTTPDQTLQILRNIAPHYERHHKVRYTEEALQACVTLTGRYITDRFFPDKAIDVMDEAGSRIHLQSAREPAELREMETALTDAQRERREAVEALVYEKAASARMREIALRSKLGETRAEWQRSLETNPVEVTAEHIQQVITSITGIPAERISGGEMTRLQMLYDHLARRVVGQQEAVEKIARTIRRSRAGLKDENRPIGVFLFVGPTGVGKTLLAKEVSKWLFDEHRGLIRIDMSEYGEKHNVARLIGSPPGYVGYGEGGQLTEAVRRQPYSVVLFDEIEKAHPEVFNSMLQIFDEGHLTDGSGRKVDFRNTIIIMTSNVGSRNVVQKSVQVGYSTVSKSATAVTAPQCEYRKALEQTFAPEFLNRIDDIVLFRTLEISDVERIIELELQGLFERTRRLGYKVKITDGAKRRLAAMGYESRYGVRSLKRTLMDNVEEPLSGLIIDGKLHEGDTVVVESDKSHGVRIRVA